MAIVPTSLLKPGGISLLGFSKRITDPISGDIPDAQRLVLLPCSDMSGVKIPPVIVAKAPFSFPPKG